MTLDNASPRVLELHILQNFAPANLNRDDTGQPKECEFGGRRRARISSQCIKRSIRVEFDRGGVVAPENLAHRTKLLVTTLTKRLQSDERTSDECAGVAMKLVEATGVKMDKDKTSYLLYLGNAEISNLVDIANAHWQAFAAMADASQGTAKQRKEATANLPKEIAGDIKKAFDGGRATDLALFGRMLADRAELNRDAASQVAHAISTNALTAEIDYFTAVDDFNPEEETGAGMIGVVEFNSSCFYRYANIDLRQLERNLAGDPELAVAAAEAFVRASINAVPTGKQNSMAAQNRPSLVLAVVRDGGFSSLTNAFIRPVEAKDDTDLIDGSIEALDRFWGRTIAMYGSAGLRDIAVATTSEDRLASLRPALVDGTGHSDGMVGAMVARVRKAVGAALADTTPRRRSAAA